MPTSLRLFVEIPINGYGKNGSAAGRRKRAATRADAPAETRFLEYSGMKIATPWPEARLAQVAEVLTPYAGAEPEGGPPGDLNGRPGGRGAGGLAGVGARPTPASR